MPSWAVEPSGRTMVSRVVRQWAFGNSQQFFVASFAGGVKNDRHVHHDVDEQRLGRDERLQILPLLHESHGQRAARLNQHLVQPLIAGEFVPGQIRAQKDEAQVVNVAIVLAVFEQLRIMLGPSAPLWAASAAMKLPHHAGQKAAGPIGPQLAGVMPLAAHGVDRKKVGMLFDEARHLPFGKFQSLGVFGNAIRHNFIPPKNC